MTVDGARVSCCKHRVAELVRRRTHHPAGAGEGPQRNVEAASSPVDILTKSSSFANASAVCVGRCGHCAV